MEEQHRNSSPFFTKINEEQEGEWTVCGKTFTRSAAVFLCQIIILYISILTCFINLTAANGPNELWITILSLSLGSILPSPKVKKRVYNAKSNSGSSSSEVPSLV